MAVRCNAVIHTRVVSAARDTYPCTSLFESTMARRWAAKSRDRRRLHSERFPFSVTKNESRPSDWSSGWMPTFNNGLGGIERHTPSSGDLQQSLVGGNRRGRTAQYRGSKKQADNRHGQRQLDPSQKIEIHDRAMFRDEEFGVKRRNNRLKIFKHRTAFVLCPVAESCKKLKVRV